MSYEQNYYTNRKYERKQQLLDRHVREVLKWAGRTFQMDLQDGKGKRALDVGCATGFTTQILTELGYEVLGLDISNWGIKQAKNQSHGELLIVDAQNSLPFLDGTFDLITCFDVLEHLLYPERALQEMFRASKGVIVCTTPNKKMDRPIRKIIHDYDETHISTKTQREWENIVPYLGIKQFYVETFYDLPMQFMGRLFFKSFNLPTYGLTLRLAIRK